MRTTLDLDEELMEALIARSGARSKTKAVEHAIREYLSHDAYRQVLTLGGSLPDFPDVRERSRAAEREREARLERWRDK